MTTPPPDTCIITVGDTGYTELNFLPCDASWPGPVVYCCEAPVVEPQLPHTGTTATISVVASVVLLVGVVLERWSRTTNAPAR